MNNWERFNGIASVILAVAMVVVAVYANRVAQTANDIAQTANGIAQTANQIAQSASQIAQNSYEVAQKSYEIAYQANLPVISAITKLRYDEADSLPTEELAVVNDGFVLSDFSCSAYALMELWSAGNQTYIPLDGYFGILGNYTGNSRGLLVSMSEKGNYSQQSSINLDFWREASNDGYQAYGWRLVILSLSYKDYTGAYWHKYYYVDATGSNEVSEDSITDILDCAHANRELMESQGLNSYISALNGTELWRWYRGQYLG
jgi:hypothetical protein